MKKNSIYDYIGCKIANFLGALFLFFPPEIYVSLGKFFGRLMFYIDVKHRDIVYRNIRFVFSREKTPRELNRMAREVFENFAETLFEILALKRVNKEYIDKYVRIEGKHLIDEALSRKKGLIFVTLHLGNWEISNAACSLLYRPYNVIIKEQRHNRLNTLLDSYRRHFGVNTVGLDSLKDIVRALGNNEIVSIVSDHGAGASDALVDFFGRAALMPQGAVRLAAKFGAPLIFAYIARINGPYHKVVLETFDSFIDTGNKEKDLEENLRYINKKFENYIRIYPAQYLWSYKRWKHSKERAVLVLSDGKAGHLRQSEAAVKVIAGLGYNVKSQIIEVKFKNKFSRLFLWLCFYLGGRYRSFSCLKNVLVKGVYQEIAASFADIVVSCGASVDGVNLIVSGQNRAKSIHILRPGPCAVKNFDLVIMPRHDHPPRGKNVAVTEGALNLIDEQYLKEQAEKILQVSPLMAGQAGIPECFGTGKYSSLRQDRQVSSNYIGFLVGGEAKNFHLDKEVMFKAIKQIKEATEKLGADILVTTSRRTSQDIANLLKGEFKDYPRCKLLVIANEKNIPEAVGGILGLSSLVVVTAESISMVSEAASSGKYVLVIEVEGLGKRHREFLSNLSSRGYIYLVRPQEISSKLGELLTRRPAVSILCDRDIVKAGLEKI